MKVHGFATVDPHTIGQVGTNEAFTLIEMAMIAYLQRLGRGPQPLTPEVAAK